MNPAQSILTDIKSLKIQGATNVALAVLDALEKTATDTPDITPEALHELGKELAYARPTEPLAQNALRYIFSDSPKTNAIRAKIATYRSFVSDAKTKIARYGGSMLTDGATYLTHCHASTVTNTFLAAHRAAKNVHIIATETRPLFQGRITVKELLAGGLENVTMIVDSAAAAVINDPKRNVAGILIGADLLTETGLVNKIGSLAIILAARSRNIPVYCFSTLLKYDPRPFDASLIETRDPKEIWEDAPTDLTLYDPAFDYTPYLSDVTVVTEAGMIKGSEVKDAALSNYPFIHI